jgi:hypothetical protein
MVKIRENIANGKKIQAIKVLRTETGSGLKEAKQAVDRMVDPTLDHLPRVITIPSIKSIIVDMGDGEVRMDLEHFNMLTLMNMQTIGIEGTRRLLDLYDMFKKWENPESSECSGEDDEEV